MSNRAKRISLILADLLLAVYLVFAFSAFNKPEKDIAVCNRVNVVIADATTHGFINADEVQARLKATKLDPKGKKLSEINCRKIEEALMKTPFIKTANCYKTQDGTVNVSITQRMPVVRIMANNNDDFYIDDQNCPITPNSQYTSDIIIATGNITRNYAINYVSPLARMLMENDLYRNLFEQINITSKQGVELIPRIGDHVVYLGKLPEGKTKEIREKKIEEFVNTKISRLVTFYRYGLSKVGWNTYSVINLEFDNQIICKRKGDTGSEDEAEATQPATTAENDSISHDNKVTTTQNNAQDGTQVATKSEKKENNKKEKI